MANKLAFKAQEGSSFMIKADFVEKNSNGETVGSIIPNSGLRWSLTDREGNVINDRNNVSLIPDESVIIILNGLDLILDGSYPATRYVTIEGTYNSIFGDDLPILIEASFQIENSVKINTT